MLWSLGLFSRHRNRDHESTDTLELIRSVRDLRSRIGRQYLSPCSHGFKKRGESVDTTTVYSVRDFDYTPVSRL